MDLPLPYLPDNIMEIIFHKLPYKAMARSILVCKTWMTIISSPKFMEDHYNNHHQSEGNHLIFLDFAYFREFNFYTASQGDIVDDQLASVMATPLQSPKNWSSIQPRLIGSYNGLVAVSTYDELVLWNPLTKKHSSVSVNMYDFHTDSHNNYGRRLLFGLCYDGSKDEYSVVVGSDYQSPPVSPSNFNDESLDYECMPVFYYDFKQRSERILRSALHYRLLDKKLFNGGVGKVVCGLPHWVVQYYDFIDPFVKTNILYFDLNEKKFKRITAPDGSGGKTMLGLATMDGENQLGCVLHDIASSTLELWGMMEYGKSESWTNLFTIPYLNMTDGCGAIKYMDVMGFMTSGKLLVYLNDKELWGYDVVKGDSRKNKLQNVKFDFVITYQPKMISPPEAVKERIDGTQEEINDGSTEEDEDDYNSCW